MTFEEYLVKVAQYPNNRRQRQGQLHFNLLHMIRPDLSDAVRGDLVLDPFYDDLKIPAFLTYVGENW